MKEEILKLHTEGLSYKKICEQLGCSKGTVSYYCGKGQKEKSKKRNQDLRKNLVILNKVDNFKNDRKLRDKTEDFQRKRVGTKGKRRLGQRQLSFNWKDVINKFGWETTCYLTGRLINLREPKTYQFDHIMPYSKGGSQSLDNLGIACKEANQAKSDMMIEELLKICVDILQHHGYRVEK